MAETETLDSSAHPSQLSDENPTGDGDEDMLDADKSTKGSDTDSQSDSDSDSEVDAQIQTLETEILNNPSNYEAHVQYIKAVRKQGDIEKLRQAREAMSAIFPLSSEMWQEWTKDEINLSSGPDALPAIEKLFECGVSDYLSVALWCDYLSFVQEHDQSIRTLSATGISKARNLFERALVAAGLHVAEGSRIWELYRVFEQAIFITMDETDADSREKQVQRIRNLFHRQLSVPLADLCSTLLTYKTWEAEQGANLDVESSNLDGLSPQVASSYQKALDMLNARTHLENQISDKVAPESERLQQFMDYLKFEQSLGDPARIQILYERAVTEFPISSELWLDYTHYMDKTLKTSSLVRDIYRRATRNCPWVGELWVRYLLSLERGRASEDELSAVFEKSLQCTFSSFEEYLDIFLTRVDGLRRRLSLLTSGVESLDYTIIRETFQRASDYLSPHLKNTESLLRMYRYWARLESTLGKDVVAARGVWESLLKISGSVLEVWQGYIAMETEMGNINEVRSLFKRCYSKRFPGTGSEDICNSWIRFEREYGALDDFDLAVKKVTPRLEELQLFKLQEAKNVGLSADDRDNSSRKNVREKRKPVSNLIEEQSPAKRHKDKAKNVKMTSQDGKGQAKDSVKVNNTKPDVSASKPVSGSKKENKDVASGKPQQYNDQCTAFVSNLNLKATYDDLRGFFSDVGGVVAIRILTDKFTGQSRGLAYVDFSDDKHLAAAVAKNKQTLLGKRLSIAKSDPKGRKKGSAAAHGASLGRGDGADQTTENSKSGAKDSAEGSEGKRLQPSSHHRASNIQLKGKNTFAMPRAVRPLGWVDKDKPQSKETDTVADENPKSNDEFRKMFIKS